MPSLYIKDEETAALAAKVARVLGTTKTEAVRRGLRLVEQSIVARRPKVDLVEWLKAYRAQHPVTPVTDAESDRQYADWLSGDNDAPEPPRR